MRNHFGELRVDVEYIENTSEIVNQLKKAHNNAYYEEEK
jgi:hypothetical protein